MNSNFEPINSNLLGEEFSNFSFRHLFIRRKHKKHEDKPSEKNTTPVTSTVVVGENEDYPPMNVNVDDVKFAPNQDVTSKFDIQLYGIKNNSKKGLKAGEKAVIRLVKGNRDSGIFAVIMEKGGQGKYVPAFYHPFKMDNEKSGGKANTIKDVLNNFFTINKNQSQDNTQ